MIIKEDQIDEAADTTTWASADDFIDRSAWPLVRIKYPAHVTKEALDRHFLAMGAIAERGEKFVALVFLDAVRNQTRELRQYIAAHLKHYDACESAKYLAGIAHVSNHWFGRAGLTLVLSLSPPPYPNRTFRRLHDAEAWLRTLLP